MRESSCYQFIMDGGRVEGEHEFGRPPAGALARLRAITEVVDLERLGVSLLDAESWDGWLGIARPAAKPPRRRWPAR